MAPLGWPEKDSGAMGAGAIAGEAPITPACGTDVTDTVVVLDEEWDWN